jgi:hypothetical protein
VIGIAAASGLLSPTVDDVFRVAIFVIGLANVVAVAIALILFRRYARLLLDVEHYAREARNRLERDVSTMAHALAALEAETARLRDEIAAKAASG